MWTDKLQKLVAAMVMGIVAGSSSVCFSANIAYINKSGGSISYLTGYGHTVTDFYNLSGLQLSQLQGFDVVIVTPNSEFSQPETIGNVVADFADAGGGVILTEFCTQPISALTGRIMQPDYSPLSYSATSDDTLTSFLGTVYLPGSELFTGVDTSQVRTQFQSNAGLNAGAILAADWASGRKAIAYRDLAENRIVSLNLFPSDTYTTDADTRKLIANAVEFSMVPEPMGLSLLILGGVLLRKRNRK